MPPLHVKFSCRATARLQKFCLIAHKTFSARHPPAVYTGSNLKIRTVGAQRRLSKSENTIFCIFSVSKQAMRAKRLLLLPITNRPRAKAVSPIGIPTHFALRTPLLMRKIILFDPLISSQALQNTNPSPRWFRSHGCPGFPQYAGSRKSAG